MYEFAPQVGANLTYADNFANVLSDVTMRQLCEIITAGLATQGIYLPAEFRLHVLNKPIRLDDDIYVREYPLANGDRLMVVTGDVV